MIKSCGGCVHFVKWCENWKGKKNERSGKKSEQLKVKNSGYMEVLTDERY